MADSNMDPEKFPSETDVKKDVEDTKTPKKQATTQTESTRKDDNVVDKLLDANQELEKKLKASQDQELRAQAEIQNIKKHNQQDQAALVKYDGQKLAESILPSIDNLERALQSVDAQDTSNQGLLTGVEMVLKHLKKALADNNITEIIAEGAEFDPQVHQAVQTVPADDSHPKDSVVQVLQTGYQLKDRVLRPSMVVVAQ
ncbi:nucleotide exchange factor GrpE [Bombilactobacillus folatiphilus]|uniref:Protein GrpE n=1 Tax=Bombilactobacillus folatiphilus TaxID=2923362 RepID=A0ABY4P7I7_9LACO|nr:nucleotide exchange factor GrpE [Bombilactobacillus folatiphilus]UQS81577.1 nucleotide exchange factor GrpE [Bombilactobacillus folatiphilus]